jgi:hypothetical protein
LTSARGFNETISRCIRAVSCIDTKEEIKMISNIAEVEVREVYGTKKVYPINQTAEYLARIAGTTTLTEATIKHAKNLGFEFKIIQPVATL